MIEPVACAVREHRSQRCNNYYSEFIIIVIIVAKGVVLYLASGRSIGADVCACLAMICIPDFHNDEIPASALLRIVYYSGCGGFSKLFSRIKSTSILEISHIHNRVSVSLK